MEEKIFASEPFGIVRAGRGLFKVELVIGAPWRYASSQIHRFPVTLTVTAPSRITDDRPEETFTVFREFPGIEEIYAWLLELEPAILAAIGFARGIGALGVADRAVMRLLFSLADEVRRFDLAALP